MRPGRACPPVSSFTSGGLREYFSRTYTAPHLLVVAAGHLEHTQLRDLVARAFADLPLAGSRETTAPPAVSRGVAQRVKDIEQSHVCVGTPAYRQADDDRHALYVLNTILGGSMSSRLFQHIREERGLAYAVFSNLTSYSDAGMVTIYAGCATDKVGEVVEADFGTEGVVGGGANRDGARHNAQGDRPTIGGAAIAPRNVNGHKAQRRGEDQFEC